MSDLDFQNYFTSIKFPKKYKLFQLQKIQTGGMKFFVLSILIYRFTKTSRNFKKKFKKIIQHIFVQQQLFSKQR